ncbi:MAG: DUF2029 domain-containing protein [Caldilineaceae bacterium]|nr:DUF2029 domain-containing protein [Caldilineaceae bacterium]HRJ40513.1 glycosyltransferase family 87 protein [Caldilineaceae bacterium]
MTSFSRRLLDFYLLAALLGSILFLVHSGLQVWSPQGAIDFHSYWFSGHFVRQGNDPYVAYFSRSQPALPVYYVDGVVHREGPISVPGLSVTPANTAPIVLLLSAFSFLSWLPAKLLWSLFNVGLMLLIPWLVISLLPGKLPWRYTLVIVLTYYCLQGTRVSIWVGQTTLLTFALMLSSLRASLRKPLLSGLSLGIALSKYSLSLPVALFYLYARKYKILFISLFVQLAALLILSGLTGTMPYDIGASYVKMVFHHNTLPGIHFRSLFAQPTWLYYGLLVSGTLLIGLVIANQYHLHRHKDSTYNIHIFVILSLWTLLVGYHRAYDTTLVIFFLSLIIYGLNQPDLWHLTPRQRNLLIGFLSLFILIMAAPFSIVTLFLPLAYGPFWQQIINYAMTLALMIALFVSIWLLSRVTSGVVPER